MKQPSKLGSDQDIEIGAVEIKNGTDDTRATVINDDSNMPATPPFLPTGGEYRATPTTYADGDATVLQTDISGNLKVTQATQQAGENLAQDVQGVIQKPVINSSYGFNAIADLGVSIAANVVAVPTMLKSISATNANAALRYLQVFNLTAAPTSGSSVPIFSWVLPAGSATVPSFYGKEFDGAGKYMSTGLSWAISTTKAVYTNGATASEHQVNGEYL